MVTSRNAKVHADTRLTRGDVPVKAHKSKKNVILKLVGWGISFGLLYWLFFVKLPTLVDLNEVWATVSGLSTAENALLCLAGLITILAVGWTASTVLPGLPVRKGTQASVVGQLTSVVLPPPLDMVIRFGMYKTYGFSVDKSAVAVVLAGIARYFTVVVVPLLGLIALIVTGQGSLARVAWLLGGVAVVVFALWLMRLILTSKKSARRVGVVMQKFVNWFRRLFRRKPLDHFVDDVVDFGERTGDVAIGQFRQIAISNVAWGLSCYLVFLMAVRFCGVEVSEMSNAYILLVTGTMLLLNTLPITPGGIGVTEAILLGAIPFSSPEVETAFASALFVYRIYTWLLPFPVGIVAYLTWRHQMRSKKPA